MTQKKHTISTAAVTSRHDASVPLPTFGIEWLQDVPGHWEVQRLKNIATVVLGKMLTTEIKDGDGAFMPYLRSMNVQWITPDVRDVKQMWISNSEMAQLRVRKGDLLVSEGGEVGRACIWNDEIPECYIQNSVHRVAAKSMMLPDFLLYQFFSYGKRGYFNAIVNRVSIAHLTREKLVTIPFTVPPLPEQRQIAAYLRAQDAHIARFIKAKRDLIKLLTEQKRRIIDHAVTRGLDASVALKPSGIEWLGDVPVHWDVLKLKFTTNKIVGGSTPKSDEPSYWDGGVIWVTPRDISKSDSINSSQRTISAAGLQSCSISLVPPGSIIITSRAPVGNVAVARVELCTNQGCKAIVPEPETVISDYLYFLLVHIKERLQILANGTTFVEIGTVVLANEFIPVPPVKEQQSICHWIVDECRSLNEAILHTKEEIKLIREYRDRLITDVVTGQVDVRGWQPGPEDVVEDAVLAALGDDQEEMTEQEDDDDED
ncbi:restriction endonuclease subunit S [Xylella fastidiosa]|uniref:Restriction endonuclease subunit S n=1 Tax=Xylella fastidiosa subsp. fastidiosa TaxID=644356 RepID=A0AAJ5R1T2_XYLFS|nr:restriction endonuclease subunit S [Xylella fastidiosa]WCF28296.1 restriction endonuclease subunit S [Xylella fastidiosa subsp. fastidiosa]